MRHAGEEHHGHGIVPTFLTFSPFFTLFTVARLVLLPRVRNYYKGRYSIKTHVRCSLCMKEDLSWLWVDI